MWTDTIIKFGRLMNDSTTFPCGYDHGHPPFRIWGHAHMNVCNISITPTLASGHYWSVSIHHPEMREPSLTIQSPDLSSYRLSSSGLETVDSGSADFHMQPFGADWLLAARALHDAFECANLQAPHQRLTMLALTTIRLLQVGATPNLAPEPTAAVLATLWFNYPRLGAHPPTVGHRHDIFGGNWHRVTGDTALRGLHNLLLTDEKVGIDTFVLLYAKSVGLPTGGFTPDGKS